MKRYTTYLLLLLAFISLGRLAVAQNISFTAAASHYEVTTGDRFKIEYKVNANIDNFKPPKIADFRVLSGPNQSTSMSWVNGKTSATISYSYILMAVKEGSFTIPAAEVIVEGKKYQSNTIEINVSKGANIQNNTNNNNSATVSKSSGDLFIKSSVNKTTVYQGEHLVATYQLFTKINIAANEMVKNADLNGFWSQEINIGQAQWSQEIINGERWNIATIRKIVLFPQRSGEIEIDPLEMRFITQKRVSGGQSIFDQFFGQVVEEEHIVKSKPIKINVLPHPSPKPNNFVNAVGQLKMTTAISATEVKANEAINIKITISGTGNLPLIDNPIINFPKEFEIYDPKITDNTKNSKTGVSGSKEYNYLVIPRYPGNFTIEPIVFSYFNPSTKKYETDTSNPIVLKINKGDGTENNVTYTAAGKENIKILGEDIRYIHTDMPQFVLNTTNLYNTWKFYTLLLLAPLLFIIVFIVRNKTRAANSDIVRVRSRKAGKLASKLLSSAKNSLAANDKNAFYEATSKALFGYVSDKLNIAVADLTQENIKTSLATKNVDENIINSLIETIDLCDMARFAPVPVSEQEVYDKAENIIQQIEKAVA